MTILPFRTRAEQERAVLPVIQHLRTGGLLAYPTETVYSFGCALEPAALEALAELKGERPDKSFLLLIADPAQVPGLAWTEAALTLAAAFWPGPLTLALGLHTGAYPRLVLGANLTVAIRFTSHPGIRRLLLTYGAPITSTSANLTGEMPALDIAHVCELLTNLKVAATFLVLDGGVLKSSLPSTLVDCSVEPPRLVRSGAIPVETLKRHVHDLRT
ncbi:MAG: L-threonylcarbamoyladenylate synthase [Longimicrobiales bacterium]